MSVVKRCVTQVEFLEKILSKIILNEGEILFSKKWKVLCSLAREKDVKQATKNLRQVSIFLTLYQVTSTSRLNNEVPSRLTSLEEVSRTVNEFAILGAHPTR